MKNSSPAAAAERAAPQPRRSSAKPRAAKPRAAAASSHQDLERDESIRRTAYALYEARGCVDGFALDDWLQAQAQFNQPPTAKPVA